MTKLLTDIPGFERGRLHYIYGSAKQPKIIFAARLIVELRRKYCTSVAYFSTHGTAGDVEDFQRDRTGLTGALYAEDLESNDCGSLCCKAVEMIDRKFVRAIIVDCIEGLDVKGFDGGIRARRNEVETCLQRLASTKNVPVLVFCPGKKTRNDNMKVIYPYLGEILPQMSGDGIDESDGRA